MFWQFIWNLLLIIPLVEWFAYTRLKRLHTIEDSYTWLFFYLLYFGVLIYHSFLPLPEPWNWHPLPVQEAVRYIQWNPFLEWQEEWKHVQRSLAQQQVDLLVQFFLRHLGNLLVFLPLTDFIHSVFDCIYRHCLAWVLILAAGVEGVQFLLLWLTGDLHWIPSLADICTAGLGSILLGGIYWILDQKDPIQPEESI